MSDYTNRRKINLADVIEMPGDKMRTAVYENCQTAKGAEEWRAVLGEIAGLARQYLDVAAHNGDEAGVNFWTNRINQCELGQSFASEVMEAMKETKETKELVRDHPAYVD